MADEFEGKVELSGFHDIDEPTMNSVKSAIRSYVKRFSELSRGFDKVTLKMKKIHVQTHSEKYEVHASVIDNGRMYNATISDNSLLFAVEAALKKIENEIAKTRVL